MRRPRSRWDGILGEPEYLARGGACLLTGGLLGGLRVHAREPQLRSCWRLVVRLVCEQAPHKRSKFLLRQGRKLQKAGVQPLEVALGHRVEVDTTNALLGTRALQPTQQNLRSTRIRDRPLPQTTLDLRVTRGCHVCGGLRGYGTR